MKAIIPMAGLGTRLRPLTHTTAKPLLRVAGKPVMSYVLDDLLPLGVREIVFIVGYLRDVVEQYVHDEYPQIRAHFVEQHVLDGTAGAVKLAQPYVDEDVLIIFVDTLFEADLSLIARSPRDWAGIIWVKEVEDYQRFGVVLTDADGFMTRIVEKPKEPVSRLANIGVYYMRDYRLFFAGVDATMARPAGPGGEYYLTDAFQYMIDRGARIQTAPVRGWYDCGKPETLLETNRHLLVTGRGRMPAATPGVSIEGPVRVEDDVVLEESAIGPNVTIERGTRVSRSRLRNCIIGPEAVLEEVDLRDSLVGGRAVVRSFSGRLNVADDSEVVG
ncbi:MAG: NTP transferase domain-containing protein [Gemmatimonadetes bacterium]|nr:NTP transferase domain-containing protein [Gemmatimonadota bacterium]